MNKLYLKLLSTVFLCSLIKIGTAQVGVYDPGFGTGGKVLQLFPDVDAEPKAVLLQTDGKIIVGGSGGDFSEGLLKIVRYNSNGTTDASFGNNGIATFTVASDQEVLQSLALQPDGKIIAGGIIRTNDPVTQLSDEDFYIFRLKTDGSPDSSFGINGFIATDVSIHSNDVLHKIILKPDGKIIAGGFLMDTNNGDNLYGLVQYHDDGRPDSSFGNNGITVIPLPQQDNGKGTLALLPNGKILAGTTVVNETSGFYEFGLLRFTADGALDVNFGIGGVLHFGLSYFHSILNDMAVQADGKIIMTGQTDENNASVVAVVKVDSTGAYDVNFGNNGVVRTHISAGNFTPDVGMAVSIQPDKKIIVGGTLDNATNSTDANFAVIRYLPNGQIDGNFGRQGIIITDFDGNGDFAAASLLQPDGKFLLVGAGRSQDYETGFGIVRYLSDARFYYNTLNGSLFYDDNTNGIKDAAEDFFGNAMVAAEKPGIDTITITASTGRFSVEVDTGNYLIHPVQPVSQVPYFITVPNSRTISHDTYFNTDSVSFAMQPIPGKRDIFVYVIPLNPARPGFTTDYMIVYGNRGTDTVLAGTVKFIVDDRVDVSAAEPAPSSVNADTLFWDYVNLYPRDTAIIIVHATIQPPPLVNIADTLHAFASISPTGLDLQPKDNLFTLNEDVVGSFDPNDKNEIHAGQINAAALAAGEYLQYMIRFQNTGTDTAFNIYVRDTLQSSLDWSSMEMVAASHPYRLIMNDGICVWSFNNIQLPATSQNEPASHGFVVYRIRPKATVTIGSNITNTASIYFDYNLPVVTNTEITAVTTTTVPVQLLSFSAKKNGKTHLLQWSTTNEIDVNHFDVQRSATGLSFEKIADQVNKPGNAGIKNYDFTDLSPLKGLNYYRIKIVDNDGRFEYSPVRTLYNSGGDYSGIYPNPVKEVLNVYLGRENKGSYRAELLALDGKTVFSVIWNLDGSTLKTINTSALPPGSYFLKIVSLTNTAGNNKPVILKLEKL